MNRGRYYLEDKFESVPRVAGMNRPYCRFVVYSASVPRVAGMNRNSSATLALGTTGPRVAGMNRN